MKSSARLVNTSRGPIVVETALISALETGGIAGAAIDTRSLCRPIVLFAVCRNLLATPHIGYVSGGLYARFYHDTVDNIRQWLAPDGS
jgi:phosphoglycerate dehydrogenase-like enzyme